MQEGIKFRFNDGNKFNDGKKPLFVVDGKVTDIDLNTIDPSSIQSITVIKDIRATDKYGEKAKYGVIEITTKNNSSGNTKKK
jgi:outer membrane receptor protein involved in Fe transport